jgi:FixJ family two-component response regulator
MERTTLHIVCGDSRSRAEQARIAFALGHHAEVYASLDELLARPPLDGIVIVCNHDGEGSARELIDRLAEYGIWLPVVIAADDPTTEQVVAAIKGGALDYLRLPLEMSTFARRLVAILADAGQHAERRRREVEAQHSIALLSGRERQVLELLSAGCSNKEIARQLEISPRTVEIHRGNMMTKLGAGHPADAVRVWIDAHLDIPAVPAGPTEHLNGHAGVAGRIGGYGLKAIATRDRRLQRQ